MNQGITLLSEGERDYLQGKNNYNEYKKRIEEKTKKLPQGFSHLIDDFELLEKNGFLKGGIKESTFSEIAEFDYDRGAAKKLPSFNYNANPKNLRFGEKVGQLLDIFSPTNQGVKIDILLGVYENLFDKVSTEEEFSELEEITKKMRKRMEELLRKRVRLYEEFTKEPIDISKTSQVVKEIWEENGYDAPTESVRVLSPSIEIAERIEDNSSTYPVEEADKELVRKIASNYFEEKRLLERANVREELDEGLEFLKEHKFMKLKAIDVFNLVSDGFHKPKEISKEFEDRGRSEYHPKINRVAKDLTEHTPPIFWKDENKYRLTAYGKCLRDILRKEFHPLDYLPTDFPETYYDHMPHHWKKVLTEHSSRSSQNESKGGVSTHVRTQEE